MQLELRIPNSDQTVITLVDEKIYNDLIAEGWKFILNRSGAKLYVKIHRTFNGVREHFFFHRYLFTARLRIGHWFEAHHINFNSLDNRLDNLAFIPQKLHRKIHAIRRWSPDCETEHLLEGFLWHQDKYATPRNRTPNRRVAQC
jgi:hypothetical protein